MTETLEIPTEAKRIYERPHPRTMALPCIWDDIDELNELDETLAGDIGDAIHERFGKIKHVLDDRLGADYPSCPECGSELAREYDGVVVCFERYCEIPAESSARDEWELEDRRIWGLRGHGGTARDGSETE